jgi:hypothetical protein
MTNPERVYEHRPTDSHGDPHSTAEMLRQSNGKTPMGDGSSSPWHQPQKGETIESNREYVPGQLLAKFKDGMTEEEIRKMLEPYGLKDLQKRGDSYLLKFDSEKDMKELGDKLRQDSNVKYAHPNWIVQMAPYEPYSKEKK